MRSLLEDYLLLDTLGISIPNDVNLNIESIQKTDDDIPDCIKQDTLLVSLNNGYSTAIAQQPNSENYNLIVYNNNEPIKEIPGLEEQFCQINGYVPEQSEDDVIDILEMISQVS
jgi:hypothetical protein